jgi:DNA mismatch repair ATPase MutL
MISVFFEGGGLKISGLVGHPNSHVSRTNDQYIFVNNRNIGITVLQEQYMKDLTDIFLMEKKYLLQLILKLDQI